MSIQRPTTSKLSETIGKYTGTMTQCQNEHEPHDLSTIQEPPLHPVQRTPNEILAILFGFCVDTDINLDLNLTEAVDFPGSLDTTKSPWVLGQICRRWRSVVLSLPHLWSTVDANWRHSRWSSQEEMAKNHENVKPRLLLALQRAQNCPLSVSWCQTQLTRYSEGVLPTLCSRSFLWRRASIDLGIDGYNLLTEFTSLPSSRFSILTTLHLHFQHESTEALQFAGSLDQLSAFKDTPNLQNITLSGDFAFLSYLLDSLPWQQITNFVAKDITNKGDNNLVGTYYQVLALMENLKTCSLDVIFIETWPFMWTVSLHHLQSLTLTAPPSATFVSPVLDTLVVPSLQILHIYGGFGFLSGVWQVLQSCSSTLVELHLHEGCCNDAHFHEESDGDAAMIELLIDLNHVHTLKLIGPVVNGCYDSVSDIVIKALTPLSKEQSPTFVPNLRNLTLGGSRKKWTDSVLVDMVDQRRNINYSQFEGILQLEQFCIEGNGLGLEDEVACAHMEELCRGGLVYVSR
ncbi:hypothetical protein L218DRAFT_1080583 [Marasmius fiardii PR-910]|nr:hypothetical protein L218DRAFT_1080583 [Marasmius fiardii PR-910]